MKEESKGKDVVKYGTSKVLLNSLYGKFGEKKIRCQTFTHMEEAKKDSLFLRTNDDAGFLMYIFETLNPSKMCYMQIAAQITSLARNDLMQRALEIINIKKNGKQLYQVDYHDTDSNFITKIDGTKFNEKDFKLLKFGKNLGDWDFEGQYKHGVILFPKKYVLWNNDDYSWGVAKKDYKFGSAGVEKKSILSKSIKDMLTYGTQYNAKKTTHTKSGIIIEDDIKYLFDPKEYINFKKYFFNENN